MRNAKSESEPEITFSDMMHLVILIIGMLLISGMQWLTRYYPFSLLFRNKMFHHQYKRVTTASEIVTQQAGLFGMKVSILHIEEDHHFIYVYTQTRVRNKEKLQKYFDRLTEVIGVQSVFVRKPDKSFYKIVIDREAIGDTSMFALLKQIFVKNEENKDKSLS